MSERERERNPARHPVLRTHNIYTDSSGSITGGGGASSPDTPPRWWCVFNSLVAYLYRSAPIDRTPAVRVCFFASTIITQYTYHIIIIVVAVVAVVVVGTRDIESYNNNIRVARHSGICSYIGRIDPGRRSHHGLNV